MRLIDAGELADKLKGLKEYIDKISINRESRCLVDVTQVIEYVENAPTVATMTNGNDLIRRADAFEAVCESCELWIMHGLNANTECPYYANECAEIKALAGIPAAEAVWIPCSERLPKINQRVLLTTNEGRVFVGYKEKPDLVWRVMDADGREHWVYDPEHYTDDIDILLKEDDCSFSEDNQYSDGFLSVTSINYDDRFEGVTAWMPLPKPYKGGDDE